MLIPDPKGHWSTKLSTDSVIYYLPTQQEAHSIQLLQLKETKKGVTCRRMSCVSGQRLTIPLSDSASPDLRKTEPWPLKSSPDDCESRVSVAVASHAASSGLEVRSKEGWGGGMGSPGRKMISWCKQSWYCSRVSLMRYLMPWGFISVVPGCLCYWCQC